MDVCKQEKDVFKTVFLLVCCIVEVCAATTMQSLPPDTTVTSTSTQVHATTTTIQPSTATAEATTQANFTTEEREDTNSTESPTTTTEADTATTSDQNATSTRETTDTETTMPTSTREQDTSTWQATTGSDSLTATETTETSTAMTTTSIATTTTTTTTESSTTITTTTTTATTTATSVGTELTSTETTEGTTKKPDGAWKIAVGVIVPLMVLLLAGAGVGFFLQRRNICVLPVFKESKDPDGMLLEETFHPIQLDQLEDEIVDMHRDTDLKFADEYAIIYEKSNKIAEKYSKKVAQLDHGVQKNRFLDILPYDHTRVKLHSSGEDDTDSYINASYIPGYNSKHEYIAAQGPLEGTVDDFWRLIWEHNVTIIVMLTNLVEGCREKCARYWPTDTEPIYYGDLSVSMDSQHVFSAYTYRRMHVSLGERKRTVEQYHFTVWPDHDCPETTHDTLDFVTTIRKQAHGLQGPLLIHCSAGVGRTGTFIALDQLLQHIKNTDSVDVMRIVMDMRQARCCMVQTEKQYIFIHECVQDALRRGMHMGYDNTCFTLDIEPVEENLYENVIRATEESMPMSSTNESFPLK